MKKLIRNLLIATASVGAIAGSTAAVVSCDVGAYTADPAAAKAAVNQLLLDMVAAPGSPTRFGSSTSSRIVVNQAPLTGDRAFPGATPQQRAVIGFFSNWIYDSTFAPQWKKFTDSVVLALGGPSATTQDLATYKFLMDFATASAAPTVSATTTTAPWDVAPTAVKMTFEFKGTRYDVFSDGTGGVLPQIYATLTYNAN